MMTNTQNTVLECCGFVLIVTGCVFATVALGVGSVLLLRLI